VEEGDDYIVDGEKWTTPTPPTSARFSQHESDKGMRGISAFIVEKAGGFTIGKEEDKMESVARGHKTIFNKCRVPQRTCWARKASFMLTVSTGSPPGVASQAVDLAQAHSTAIIAAPTASSWAELAFIRALQFMRRPCHKSKSRRWCVFRARRGCGTEIIFETLRDGKLFASDVA
jgi:hypothetical protein